MVVFLLGVLQVLFLVSIFHPHPTVFVYAGICSFTFRFGFQPPCFACSLDSCLSLCYSVLLIVGRSVDFTLESLEFGDSKILCLRNAGYWFLTKTEAKEVYDSWCM